MMDIVQVVNRVLHVRPIENEITMHSMTPKASSNEESQRQEKTKPPISNEELEKAIEKANQKLLGLHTQFDFKVHKGTGRTVVRLIDKQTEEVIKEIPPEKMLDVIAGIWDLAGIAVDRKE